MSQAEDETHQGALLVAQPRCESREREAEATIPPVKPTHFERRDK